MRKLHRTELLVQKLEKRERRKKKMGKARREIMARMSEMNCIGKSRHEAKLKDGRFVENKIFSKRTYAAYMKICLNFHRWCRKNFDKITKSTSLKNLLPYTQIYINYLNEQGKATATIKQEVAALNKLYELNTQPQDKKIRMPDELKNKTKIKNQVKRTYTKEFEKVHEKELNFCRAFGVRTGTVTQFNKQSITYDKKNNLLILHVKGDKGGRDRDVICLPEYQEYIYDWWGSLNDDEKFISKIDARIDYQDLRIDYAKKMYQLLENQPELKPKIYDALRLKKIYTNTDTLIPRKKDYKKFRQTYNKENLYLTSKNLGHNRIDVVYQNYLAKQN